MSRASMHISPEAEVATITCIIIHLSLSAQLGSAAERWQLELFWLRSRTMALTGAPWQHLSGHAAHWHFQYVPILEACSYLEVIQVTATYDRENECYVGRPGGLQIDNVLNSVDAGLQLNPSSSTPSSTTVSRTDAVAPQQTLQPLQPGHPQTRQTTRNQSQAPPPLPLIQQPTQTESSDPATTQPHAAQAAQPEVQLTAPVQSTSQANTPSPLADHMTTNLDPPTPATYEAIIVTLMDQLNNQHDQEQPTPPGNHNTGTQTPLVADAMTLE
ncbi:hypothetical protein BKA82DRAFT_4450924 [Pisolithus tinctorius]|nr:hypothetical protein BKA82DRAFT_4450924 [Pisolithus tinctorius]